MIPSDPDHPYHNPNNMGRGVTVDKRFIEIIDMVLAQAALEAKTPRERDRAIADRDHIQLVLRSIEQVKDTGAHVWAAEQLIALVLAIADNEEFEARYFAKVLGRIAYHKKRWAECAALARRKLG